MSDASTKPRVLLVEDDPAMQKYVSMALQHLEIELLIAGTVAEALKVLAAGPVRLVITDLMLPDESGLALMRRLRADAALRGDARIAVASAALEFAAAQELRELGAWRLLPKPVSLEDIEACVLDALPTDAVPVPEDAATETPQQAASECDSVEGMMSGARAAVAAYFAGDEQLYREFRATCLPQFAIDAADGDACVAKRDTELFRRIAHSLKTVLQTLGEPVAEVHARRLEGFLLAGDWPAAIAEWPPLRSALVRLSRAG